MKPRVFAFIGIILLVFFSLNYYIGWNGAVFFAALFNHPANALYWSIFLLFTLSFIISRFGSRFMPKWLTTPLKIIGSYWLAVILYGIILLPFADLAAWLLRLVSVPEEDSVLVTGMVVIIILLTLLLRGRWNATSPIVRKYEVSIAKSAGDIKQLRIAAASDLHLGTLVGKKHLQQLVDQLEMMKPDLILLPGDIIDDEIEPFIRLRMGEIMKQLHAPYGVFAVLGNHEYIGGDIEEFVKEMKACGIEVLMDSAVKVRDSFYVIGRKDKAVERFGNGSRMDLDTLLMDVDKSLPLLLMDHQPYYLGKAAEAGIDVMLSGHTHRGQMAPSHWITRKLFELDWGYLQKDSMHAIVSSGYGSWGPPIRIGSRAEIIELTIHFDPVPKNLS
ncbi:metallophosphoesterase [Paenibacillus sp. UNC451MF]|uniref:metallophosphoesterase n=1 Tax=Paenibacillus sp. UNC451MF TaxID=1449063 RepID=UPI000491FA3F|nr:metallophosphoesterase [Paenibacillus sp. UNC451MF]